LQWNKSLCNDAARWAQHLASKGKLCHSKGCGQGENLCWMSSGCSNPYQTTTQSWIDEFVDYHDERIGEGDFASYGHYSELKQV
jgi:hypothetical protein